MALYLTRPVFDPMVISWIGTAVAVSYAAYLTYQNAKNKRAGLDLAKGSAPINPSIKKDEPKVVDTIDVEDMGQKSVFCRCWKSKKFPYCDGSHGAHNKECGDNVGPLIIQNKNTTSTR